MFFGLNPSLLSGLGELSIEYFALLCAPLFFSAVKKLLLLAINKSFICGFPVLVV